MTETWSDKRIENWGKAAHHIAEMCARIRREQDAFIFLLGLTWEQVRELPQAGQDAVNYAWQNREVSK